MPPDTLKLQALLAMDHGGSMPFFPPYYTVLTSSSPYWLESVSVGGSSTLDLLQVSLALTIMFEQTYTRPLLKRQSAAVLHLHEGKGAKLTGVAIGNAPWIADLATAPT